MACYVGGLTAVRGVKEMIQACDRAGVKLVLAGEFDNPNYFNQIKAMPEWENVDFLGYVPNAEVGEKVYKQASVGLVLLHKAPNHTHSIPIKQFEYMQAGLPVIASREVLFCKQVTEEENCGLVVDPLNIDEVAQAIRTITSDSELAKQMSANAKQASADKYNWLSQEKSLLEFYQSLFD
jgi:glycosyltransferase involved in cell wall biosynthesis